jgi:energy-coupling factor transporter transmembrane protein EcfT
MSSKKAGPVPNRSFAILIAVALCFVAKGFWRQNFNISVAILSLSLLLFIVGLTIPHVLTPVTKLWLKFGDLLHRIISPVILLLIYVTSIVPTGIIMKIFGKDPLTKKPDSSLESYWVIRHEDNQPTGETMGKQF